MAAVASRLFGSQCPRAGDRGDPAFVRRQPTAGPDGAELEAAIRTGSVLPDDLDRTTIWPRNRWPPGSSRPSASMTRPGTGRWSAAPDHGPSRRRAGLAAWTGLEARDVRHRDPADASRRVQARTRDTARPLFAFRLHQFLSKGDTVYVSLGARGRAAHHRHSTRCASRVTRTRRCCRWGSVGSAARSTTSWPGRPVGDRVRLRAPSRHRRIRWRRRHRLLVRL